MEIQGYVIRIGKTRYLAAPTPCESITGAMWFDSEERARHAMTMNRLARACFLRRSGRRNQISRASLRNL